MRTLQALGWDWTTDGAVLTFIVDGTLHQVLVPIAHVRVTFSREMQRVGCPLPHSVGAPSVGGFFDSISKAYKSATRAVKKAVPKALSKAAKVVSRQAKSYARNVADVAKRTIRDPKQLVLAGMTGGLSLAAQSKLHRDVLGLGRYVPGPVGTAATAGLAGGEQLANIAQGKRVDLGKLAAGLAEAGAAYVPGGGALGRSALQAGSTLARGGSLQSALEQGALEAGSAYVPQRVLETGLAVAKGQRVDRALKSALLKEASKGLKGLPLPSTPALAQAATAWQRLNDAKQAARRIERGLARVDDATRAARGRGSFGALMRTIRQAQRGDRRARELVSAFRRVGACI